MSRLATFLTVAALVALGLTLWVTAGVSLMLEAACRLAEEGSC